MVNVFIAVVHLPSRLNCRTMGTCRYPATDTRSRSDISIQPLISRNHSRREWDQCCDDTWGISFVLPARNNTGGCLRTGLRARVGFSYVRMVTGLIVKDAGADGDGHLVLMPCAARHPTALDPPFDCTLGFAGAVEERAIMPRAEGLLGFEVLGHRIILCVCRSSSGAPRSLLLELHPRGSDA